MPRHRTDNDDADSGPTGAEADEERSSAAAISPPTTAAAAAPSAGAIATNSPGAAAPSTTAGVEYHPSSDDAPVPLAQALAAYDEAEMDSKKKGVEVIESSGDDVPVPLAMMDASYDEAEKGSAMARKSVELVDDNDEGPAPPGHTADDGSDSKMKAKKVKAGRVRDDALGISGGDSIVEPVFEEDATANLATASAPREDVSSGNAGGSNARIVQREVPRPSPAESTVPVFHEVHARLVEDEPEQPVYDAVPLEEEHWAKRHQKKIGGGLVMVIVALVVALGVAFGTGGGNDAAVVFATSPPTRSLSPSSQPSMYEHPCFVDRRELQAAVDSYTAGGATCWRGESECAVVQKYGWPIGTWCTSNVTDTSDLFQGKETFNDDLSSWNTSKVTSMAHMFSGALSFNGDVSNFDTSSVTSMESMFRFASSFNGDLSNFNTSQVTSMKRMFARASSFNHDVSNFDTSKVTSMESMFASAFAFNRDLSNFNTSEVTSMGAMFGSAFAFNGVLSNFDTSKVTSMDAMFASAFAFNQDVSGWDVASVTDMRWMFSYASSFNQNLCAWGDYNATGVYYDNMFRDTNCTNQGDPQGPDTNWCAATCQ